MAELTAAQRAEISEIVRQALTSPAVMTAAGTGSVPVPDPTKLTTEAVDRASKEWDRQLASAIAILETRLEAMDTATELNAQRLNRVRPDIAADLAHLASDTDRQILALRELLGERVDGMDVATKLLAANVTTLQGAIDKSAAGIKEIIETRLAAMDEATKLLAVGVDKVPYAILQEAGNLKGLIFAKIEDVSHVNDQRFAAIDAHFESNERALVAALAAQKEAAAEQNKSNTLAIAKSEQATKETIAANATQSISERAALSAQISDLKDRLIRLEAGGLTTRENYTEDRADATYTQTGRLAQAAQVRANMSLAIGAVGALVAIVAVLYAAIHG